MNLACRSTSGSFASSGYAVSAGAGRWSRGGIPRAALALLAVFAGVVVLTGIQRTARADLMAAYVQGHGGVSSVHVDGVLGQKAGTSPALGFQAGARLLGLEVYGDYTSFGEGAAVRRGILGLRLGFKVHNTRLELRGGGGFISEYGGALTGPLGAANRGGVVGRVGVNLENRIGEALLIGFGITAESFALDNSLPPSAVGLMQQGGWIRGSDIFASLHLKFEVGI